MKNITTILMLVVTFTSCSSDDNTVVEDFTSKEYMKSFLTGTWVATESKGSGGWSPIYFTSIYVFNEDYSYTYNHTKPSGSKGTYKITPESGTLEAIIELHYNGINKKLRVAGYGEKVIILSEPNLGSGTTDYRYKKR